MSNNNLCKLEGPSSGSWQQGTKARHGCAQCLPQKHQRTETSRSQELTCQTPYLKQEILENCWGEAPTQGDEAVKEDNILLGYMLHSHACSTHTYTNHTYLYCAVCLVYNSLTYTHVFTYIIWTHVCLCVSARYLCDSFMPNTFYLLTLLSVQYYYNLLMSFFILILKQYQISLSTGVLWSWFSCHWHELSVWAYPLWCI